MRRFNLSEVQFVVSTGIADVFRAQFDCHGPVCVKYYRSGHMGNERAGITYLKRARGRAVEVYRHLSDLVIMEWVDGRALAEIARAGAPEIADVVLAQVTTELHRTPLATDGLTPMEDLFLPLVSSQANEPPIKRAKELLLEMLASGAPHVALHGDLHHDNVLGQWNLWRVIDAKGLKGPVGYELANAFRHPRGCPEYATDPYVIDRRADLWSEALRCSPQILLRWAAIKAALSILWAGGWTLANDADRQLLDILLMRD